MKTERELNEDILELTTHIMKTYPELSKYVADMSVKASGGGNKENAVTSLANHYEYLEYVMKNYMPKHANNHMAHSLN
jgi:hypothetical protein